MKKAFTLAEVLITIAIIGIVAALTIPSVIANAQQQEFKTGLKKAVSVLNEAIQVNIAQDGETPYETKDLFDYMKRHMPTTVFDSNEHGCVRLNKKSYCNAFFYTTDGFRFEFPYDYFAFSSRELFLHESGVRLESHHLLDLIVDGPYTHPTWGIGKCGSYGLLSNKNNTVTTPCLVVVDVNGDKKPNPKYIANKKFEGTYDLENTFSLPKDKKLQDMFTIMITDEKAIPFGVVAQRAMYSK